MKLRRRVVIAVVGTSVLLAATIAWNSAGAAPVAPLTPVSTALNASDVAGSVAYLESKYGVSQAEAMRRLNLQAEAAQIDQQLQANFANAYGGLWMDQAHGGVMHVAATDTARISAALKKLPDLAHIRVSHVKRTLKQLDALKALVSRHVTSAEGAVAIDVTTNQVVIYQRSGGAAIGRASRTIQAYDKAQGAPAQPDTQLRALVKKHPGVVLRQMMIGVNRSAPAFAPTSCIPQKCPPPLRGGMRLDVHRTSPNTDPDNLDPMWGQCTVGFIVYDGASSQFYVLTAGHCVVGSDKTGITHTYSDSGVEIGYETDYENTAASYPTDYALLTIPNYTYWLGSTPQVITRAACQGPQTTGCYSPLETARNTVDVYCTGVEATGCVPRSIQITGYASYSSSHVGDVVCATGSGNNDPNHGGYASSGAAPGTRCGEVINVNGGFVTNICSRKGDSGGPLFSEVTHLAYGILNDGTAGTGNCPAGNTEWSQYSPVAAILSAVNAQAQSLNGTPGQFVLRTAP